MYKQSPYQSLRKVRKVATNVLLPTSSLEVVGLCFSTHSWPPAKAPAPPPKLALPLLLGPADAPDDLAPEQPERMLKRNENIVLVKHHYNSPYRPQPTADMQFMYVTVLDSPVD